MACRQSSSGISCSSCCTSASPHPAVRCSSKVRFLFSRFSLISPFSAQCHSLTHAPPHTLTHALTLTHARARFQWLLTGCLSAHVGRISPLCRCRFPPWFSPLFFVCASECVSGERDTGRGRERARLSKRGGSAGQE